MSYRLDMTPEEIRALEERAQREAAAYSERHRGIKRPDRAHKTHPLSGMHVVNPWGADRPKRKRVPTSRGTRRYKHYTDPKYLGVDKDP